MKKHLIVVALTMMTAWGCTSEQSPVYKDVTADIEERVEDLVGRMTFEEKMLQLNQYTGHRTKCIM